MGIGKKISNLRKSMGLTQEELGEKLSFSGQTVSKWENDLSYPDLKTLTRLSKIFGCTLDEIVHDKQPAPQIKSGDSEDIDRRILTVTVDDYSGGNDKHSKVTTRFPIALIRLAIKNNSLENLMSEGAEQVKAIMEMIDCGITGDIVNVDNGDSMIVIKVENYES